MERRTDDLSYDEFINVMREFERTGEKYSYRKILARCGGSSTTIRKFLDRYLKELTAPSPDLPLSIEVSRSITREIQRQVAYICQEQRERIDQVNRLIEDAFAVNATLIDRSTDAEQALAAVRGELSELKSRYDDLQNTLTRERKGAADALLASQADAAALRQEVNSLNHAKGRLAANLEKEEHLRIELADRLEVAERASAESRLALQAKEIAEATLAAEMKAGGDNLTLHKTMLSETQKALGETRSLLLEAEKRCASLEALQERARQKGNEHRAPSPPVKSN